MDIQNSWSEKPIKEWQIVNTTKKLIPIIKKCLLKLKIFKTPWNLFLFSPIFPPFLFSNNMECF